MSILEVKESGDLTVPDLNESLLSEGSEDASLSDLSDLSDIYNTDKTVSSDESLSFLKKGSELIELDVNIEWVVEGLIPKQSITLLHGRGGIGKTWISLILGNVVSKGIPFMDLKTQEMSVTFVDFENSLPVLVERVKKIGASEVLFWHNTNKIIRPPKFDSKEWELYKKLPIGLIIIDTLRASQSKDENDSKDMSFVMSRLKELRDKGYTILLLHHTPKSNDRTYKGSTAILDLADHVLSLHRVRKTNLDVVIDNEDDIDETDCYFRFGTKDKTRYEPFHIYLSFNPEKGFEIAPDPDQEDLEAIYQLMAEKDRMNQSQVYELARTKLDIKSKDKTVRLLKKGTKKGYWEEETEGRGKPKYYSALTLPSCSGINNIDSPDRSDNLEASTIEASQTTAV